MRGGFKYLLAVLFFLLLPTGAGAASLYLSPASGSYALNSNIAVNVYVSSADKAMNAVSGALDFPADKLQVTSVSKAGSVINLWVTEPSYSNSNGTVNFEGVALNPGYTGSGGKIITINFKVKSAGAGAVSFIFGSVLANDGQGTEILTGKSGAGFTLGEGKPLPPPVEAPVPAGKPVAPNVSSVTHPDPDKWYSVKDAKFAWSLPVGVSKARLLVDSKADSDPSVVYSPAVGEKEMKDVGDGVWYFHAQLNNAKGWGGIAHFRFQIDSANPIDLKVVEVKREDQTDPRVSFKLTAVDDGSGIDYYEIRVDNTAPIIWKDAGTPIYETVSLKSGDHILTVRVFDQAGNSALESLNFSIKSLAQPVIENYPENLRTGSPLVIIGKTYPSSQVTGYLQKGATEPVAISVMSDVNGRFVFAPSDELRSGNYLVWFQVVKDNGARSATTDKFAIAVSEPAILRVGSLAVNVLAVIIPLIALVIMLGGVLWYGAYRFKQTRQSLRVKTDEVGLARRAFDALLVNLQSEIDVLERTHLKRKLTVEETAILGQLKNDLAEAQKFLGCKPKPLFVPKVILGKSIKPKKR
ncbi:MAG: hypothetical protein A3J93_02970 [Candidatus Magasanikbacteria bacterium RIFOXYC2_FULL_42_28]|uniref:Cohesin domain-containing protein n=1 Tax=Candidatus Magasanikbacteria bacterium RIFOXYC2_FULL_42_28 TaxID=1798704 RepID=A0A1F6NUG5_9BACT|nr:MAG: hypothetical protein A3J93_02970 [Candidatus Magasanikbacteria bacterium RIFOXYC2_FULL_42_28]